VTAAELALSLAAFNAAGARRGDRIEHGGVISPDAIREIRTLGLTVVTQPAFVRERGDRYLAEVEPRDRPDLYRCATLRTAGVPVAASSDAPYASADPWLGLGAAMDRRTAGGVVLGPQEAVDGAVGLSLYLGAAEDPGGPPRRVTVGAPADLVLLDAPMREVLAAPAAGRVRATFVGGSLVYAA
jgi:predicted amidohydrolase YtcJ